MIKCKGCGAVFQTTDKDKTGYVKSLDHQFCFRCFNLRNFNLNIVSIDDAAITSFVDSLKSYKTIVVVVDIFSFSFLDELKNNGLEDKEIVLVINKFDLLPKSINEQRIINWIQDVYYNLDFLKILFVSATKKINIDNSLRIFQKLGGELPIIGKANVGKSSIINAMKKSIDPNDESLITISYYPGTTLDKVEWVVDDNLTIVDTPGITYDAEYISQLDKDALRLFFPKKEIKPTTFQLQTGQSIFINGFVLCSFKNDYPISLTYYISNEFYLHRCKTENVADLIKNHQGIDVIVPPLREEVDAMHFITKTFKVTKEFSEIEFPGFGWLDIHTNEDMEVEIMVPKSCKVAIRKAMYKERNGQ